SFRIAVLASGRGSNLQAIHLACQNGHLKSTIAGVFSDKKKSGAIAFSKQQGIPCASAKASEFSSREAFDEHLFSLIESVQPDLIVCAGYLRLISAKTVEKVQSVMINIHPSLLPKFPGLHTHARALAAGEKLHGASVHCVIPELDAGPVLSQVCVEVLPDDTDDMLEQRVLAREHALLVETIVALEQGRILLQSPPVKALQLDTENILQDTK
ncbi:MAG: phosphoribosylglycinamide formyltransferase, partial [Arenimonas sp.]